MVEAVSSRIIRESWYVKDEVGQPISVKSIRQLYKGVDNQKFWDFVEWLRQKNCLKFCVSLNADTRFSRDEEMRFFELIIDPERKISKIIFLGQGKAGSIEIRSPYAADTWGYAVLMLREKEGKGYLNAVSSE